MSETINITITGSTGTGKTTLAHFIALELAKHGVAAEICDSDDEVSTLEFKLNGDSYIFQKNLRDCLDSMVDRDRKIIITTVRAQYSNQNIEE